MQIFTGLEYLKIDIASNFGLDKLDWQDRIAWVDAHEQDLEQKLQEAETPALYHAGVQAYRRTQQGLPTGYPISLDAASSGLQLLAILAGCEASARLCGVVPSGHREDAYTVIYKAMLEKIGDTAKIKRKDTKQAIMTSLYSSTSIPKKIFGEGALLKTFYQTMEEMAPGAWELNHALKELWQADALSHDWVLPDNFHVHIKVMEPVTSYVQFLNRPVAITVKENRGTKEGRSLGPNLIHSVDGMIVREMQRRCDYDPDKLIELLKVLTSGEYRSCPVFREEDKMVQTLWNHYLQTGFLSTRILDYLDACNLILVSQQVIKDLIKTLPEKPFQILSIHDCFRCHPNYGNDMRKQYNQILSDLAASYLLENLVSQIAGYHIPVIKGADLSKVILEADYTIT